MDRKIKKSKWQSLRPMAIVGILVVSASVLFAVSSRRGDMLKIDANRMRVDRVEKGQFQDFIALSGSVVPLKTYYLDAKEGGSVESRFVEAGTYVEKGDPILSLANTNLLLDIMYREAELFQQSNNLRNTKLAMEQNRLTLQSSLLDLDYEIRQAERVYLRNQKLSEKDMIPQEEFDASADDFHFLQRKRDLTLQSFRQDSVYRAVQIQQLEAGLQRMENNMEIVKQNLENLVIKAPVSGQLTALNAEIGESKVRGERLGQIDIMDGFKIQVPVDEHYITRLNLGQRAHFTLDGNSYGATLIKIYPEVTNGRFQVDLEFDQEPEGIRRGQTLHLRLELNAAEDAVLLARGAFYQTTGGQWVYVLSPDGNQAERRDIKLGRQNQDVYEVLEGLNPGERVITSSYDRFGNYEHLELKTQS